MLSTAARLGAVLVLALTASAAQAATYYVATNGNDGNPGSLSRPWKTLQHAADRVAAGDTILVRAGNYAGADFETPGTAAHPIVLQAYPGEAPAITANNPATPDGINLEGASYMTVQGFTVNGRTRAGIRAVACQHVTIRDNKMDQNGYWGILTGFCDDLLIDHNVASRSVRQHGIYVSNSGDRPVVRRNTVWGNSANGIHMNADGSEGGDGIITGALVEANIIYGNGATGGSGINMDGVARQNPAMDWTFVDRLRKSWKGKLMIKGIDSAEDARLCLDHGVDGVWLSNHGGRSTETARSTIEALPEVVAAVGGRIPVYVDGGVRRGTDVFKALALGATGVGIGRPFLWGLGAFGQPGVDRVLDIMQRELKLVMGNCGTRTVADITREYVATPDWKA